MFKLNSSEISVLVSACGALKTTLQPDNQRGRDELNLIIDQVNHHHTLNSLGTNFTFIKQALRYYASVESNEMIQAQVQQLLNRFKGIC